MEKKELLAFYFMNDDQFNAVCLKYSIPAFLAALTAGMLFTSTQATPRFPWTAFFTAYILASLAAVVLVFALRTSVLGMESTTNLFELSIAALSAIGFSLPIAILGLFLAGIGEIDYEGAEKWLPEIKSSEEEIQRIIAELDLSEDIYFRAMELMEEVTDYGLTKGRPASEMAPAIVYIAAREGREPRTLEDVSQVARSSKKEIGRAYRHIGRNTGVSIRPPSPEEYLDRFADKMGLSMDVKNRARIMVEQSEEKTVTSGKSPGGIAISALYLAAHIEGENRTMKDMSDTLGITSATIRNRSKDLVDALDLQEYPEHLQS